MAKHRRPPPHNKKSAPLRPVPMVDQLSRRLQAAQALWNEGRHSDAIDLFREAIRQEPNNVHGYVMLARAYSEQCCFDLMEQTHEKLVQRAPRHPGIHHYIGETYGLLKLPERAIAAYQKSAHLPGAGPPTWMELASLYERAHRLDEAEELIERAVRSGYGFPLVSLVRGRIQRRKKQLDKAEASFRAVILQAHPNSDWAAQAWSELAL